MEEILTEDEGKSTLWDVIQVPHFLQMRDRLGGILGRGREPRFT